MMLMLTDEDTEDKEGVGTHLGGDC